MKTKHFLRFTLLISLLVAAAFVRSLPSVGAETGSPQIETCRVRAYVADTDPNGVNVRSGPGQNYPIVTTLPYHDSVLITRTAGEWMGVIKYDYSGGGNNPDWDKPIGWVSGKLLAVTATTQRNSEPDISGLVPIYGGSPNESAIVAWVPQDTELRIIACKVEYVKVQYKGVEGWLSFLDFSDDPPSTSPTSGGTKTAGMEVTLCDSVAAFVIDKDPNGLNIRTGPGVPDFPTEFPSSFGYPAIGTLPTDRPVQVYIIGALRDWVLIKDPVLRSKGSGEMTMEITGWVKASLLGVRAENAEDFTGTVSLYKDGNAESGVIAEVPGDTGVTILAARGAWLKVRYEKQEGWLAPDAQCGDPFKECH